MHHLPNCNLCPSKLIAKKCSKLSEVGPAHSGSYHPCHGTLIIMLKHDCGEELLNHRNVIALFYKHKVLQTQLLHNPDSIIKVPLPCQICKVNRLLRTNGPFSECVIDLYPNQLLLVSPIVPICRGSLHIKEWMLPEITEVFLGQALEGVKICKHFKTFILLLDELSFCCSLPFLILLLLPQNKPLNMLIILF